MTQGTKLSLGQEMPALLHIVWKLFPLQLQEFGATFPGSKKFTAKRFGIQKTAHGNLAKIIFIK